MLLDYVVIVLFTIILVCSLFTVKQYVVLHWQGPHTPVFT